MSVFGVETDEMPDGWTPLEVVVVVKALDEEGKVELLTRSSNGLMLWDGVGMLTAALDVQRHNMRRALLGEEE